MPAQQTKNKLNVAIKKNIRSSSGFRHTFPAVSPAIIDMITTIQLNISPFLSKCELHCLAGGCLVFARLHHARSRVATHNHSRSVGFIRVSLHDYIMTLFYFLIITHVTSGKVSLYHNSFYRTPRARKRGGKRYIPRQRK